MALKKDLIVNEQLYSDCYISFEHIIIDSKEEETGNRNIRAVLFARARKGDENPVCFFDCNFVYDLESPDNLWKQGYAVAKQIPELDGAEDI